MCLVKRFIVRFINKQLKENAGNISKVKEVVTLWSSRIKRVLFCLECLLAKLDDNEITADEIKQASDDINALVKEWK
jgi:hypothetical protein